MTLKKTLKKKQKTNKQFEQDKTKGKIGYRLRKQLENEGDKELKDFNGKKSF